MAKRRPKLHQPSVPRPEPKWANDAIRKCVTCREYHPEWVETPDGIFCRWHAPAGADPSRWPRWRREYDRG